VGVNGGVIELTIEIHEGFEVFCAESKGSGDFRGKGFLF